MFIHVIIHLFYTINVFTGWMCSHLLCSLVGCVHLLYMLSYATNNNESSNLFFVSGSTQNEKVRFSLTLPTNVDCTARETETLGSQKEAV